MPHQGDKKIYIGDIWADKDKEEYQRKFIEDILEAHQSHGKKFNADMVDGKHATDFATAEQGALAETAVQSFRIGETLIDNNVNQIFIGTEAIKILNETIEKIPWTKWFGTDYADPTKTTENAYKPTNLTEALEYLYHLLQNGIEELDDTKVDKECVKDNNGQCVLNQDESIRYKVLSDNNFSDLYKDKLDTLSESVTEVHCYNCADGTVSSRTKTAINADTINGLQFILVTPQIYENLPAACKANWRNIFIFVENIPADYDSPLTCSFKNGFIFDIDDDRDYIVYKSKDATEWLDLISLNELYSRFREDVVETIIDTIIAKKNDLSETINGLITPLTVENLLKEYTNEISIEQASTWPFIPQVLLDDLVYDIYRVEDNVEISFPTQTLTSNDLTYKRVNLSGIYETINTKHDSLYEGVFGDNGVNKTLTNLINTKTNGLDTRVTALENIGINDKFNTLTTTLGTRSDTSGMNTAFGRIATLDSRVSALESWEDQLNHIHLFVGRWNSRNDLNRDVTTDIGKIEIEVYDKDVADQYGKTDTNPHGLYVRVNNAKYPNASINGDIFDDLRIHLTIKGMTKKNTSIPRPDNTYRLAESWFTFDNKLGPNGNGKNVYGDFWRKINGAQRNTAYQTYYMSDKVSIEWVDVTTIGDSTRYLIEATPYAKGHICGNIVQIPLIVTKPNPNS